MSTGVSRRSFLKATATAGAGLTAVRVPVPDLVLGAHDRIRVGVIGLGRQGLVHVRAFASRRDVDVVAICDSSAARVANCARAMEQRGWRQPARHCDPRRLLDDATIDAVTIATPNGSHAQLVDWAGDAGKDVYLETPIARTWTEGRHLAGTAPARHLVYAGQGSRLCAALEAEIERLRSGLIGVVRRAEVRCFLPAGRMRRVAPGTRASDWRTAWATGNGEEAEAIVELFDIGRRALGVECPHRVEAAGARLHSPGEVPNLLTARFHFPGKPERILDLDVRPVPAGSIAGRATGVVLVHGSDGVHQITSLRTADGQWGRVGGETTWNAFIAGLRSRDVARSSQVFNDQQTSTTLLHLAHASYRLGRSIEFDASIEHPHRDDEQLWNALNI